MGETHTTRAVARGKKNDKGSALFAQRYVFNDAGEGWMEGAIGIRAPGRLYGRHDHLFLGVFGCIDRMLQALLGCLHLNKLAPRVSAPDLPFPPIRDV